MKRKFHAALTALALAVTMANAPAWAQTSAPTPAQSQASVQTHTAGADATLAAVANIQQQWAVIQYQSAENARADRLKALAEQAHAVTAQYPKRAEPYIWEGIVLSSWANVRGGLGALSLVKQARSKFETAISIDPTAMDGSALSSLGVLYYKVPGWPLGFGDSKKAKALLQQALSVNPNGIDTNFFYADYLAAQSDKAGAYSYLQKAMAAPPRPGREVADAGRREDIGKLLAQVKPGS